MTTATCLATTFGVGPDLLSWLALFAICGFVLSLLAVLILLAWLRWRSPSGTTIVLPLRRRLRAQDLRADPRYDPKQFRSKR